MPPKNTHKPSSLDRRKFLATAGAAIASAGYPVAGKAETQHVPHRASSLLESSQMPSRVLVQNASGSLAIAERNGSRFTVADTEVQLRVLEGSTEVHVACPKGALSRVVLRWDAAFPQDTLFLADAWERSYGELQWRFLEPERVMPWYFAAHQESSHRSFMLGVKTQPSAMCFWTVDHEGISLWLDFRNGGSASLPGERSIPAAKIVAMPSRDGETALAALRRFCAVLCEKPRLASSPICGNNSWYYTYGENFTAETVRRDAAFLGELAGSHKVRPFCVIDGGWSPGGGGPGGPWTAGEPKTFPDMPGLAADIRKQGVRPGIWIRPTALHTVDNPARLRSGPINSSEKPLDPTLPENVESIHADVARMRSWGYELIKHDFSTYDLFGRWGNHMGAELTDAGWHFHNRSLTNAEIVQRLYSSLRDAAGDALLIGCNTIGHIGAGFFEAQRIGDDVSGRAWERTRRMGINTLAYRLAQNRTFFACDPDCAAHTEAVSWELDRQFLDLVARSGTALFVSVDPQKITEEQKRAFHQAMQTALSGGDAGGCEPLDWLHNTTPNHWRFGTQQKEYKWSEPQGTSPFSI